MSTILSIIIGFVIGFLVATGVFTYIGYRNWNASSKQVEQVFQNLNETNSKPEKLIKEKGDEE